MRRLSFLLIAIMLTVVLAACGDDGSQTGPPQDALVIQMLYGSEKEAWIEEVTGEFNNQGKQTAGGETIYVEAIPAGSADSMERILSRRDQPVIWSPASSILVPVAQDRWAGENNGAELIENDPPPLVLSPVVIAMWQPMAEALGWPNTPIGWADIAEITRSDQSWADFGHPEWGPWQFGHTHPDFSNSGITSILATVYAATGKTTGLTVEDVQQPDVARFLHDVEQGVIHYGESTGFFGRQMFNRGPGYLSAAVLYENLVVESYDAERFPNRPMPVVAIYPKEGTFWSDHPFVILNADWVTEEMKEAAAIYRDYLLAEEQQRQALEFGFRPADPQIAIGAPITPEYGVDPDQPQTLLEVPRAEVTQSVRELWGENKKRVEVQVVLDISGSMNDEGRLANAKTALRNFIGQLDDRDSLGLTVFSNEARALTELSELGPKRQEVLDRIDGLFADGGTRLLDTVEEAYRRLQSEPPGERIRAIVVLTDGADNESAITPAELTGLLSADQEGRSIKVFTIAYGSGNDVDADLLQDISDASGAKTYQSRPGEIEEVYRDIVTFF
jgi:Ca-activated chloride channel family protein